MSCRVLYGPGSATQGALATALDGRREWVGRREEEEEEMEGASRRAKGLEGRGPVKGGGPGGSVEGRRAKQG